MKVDLNLEKVRGVQIDWENIGDNKSIQFLTIF